MIGENEIKEIVKRYQTPFYLYDITGVRERIELIKKMLPDIGVCYAMKAAPMLAGSVEKTADRLEVCSPGEYEICFRAGVAPGKILVSGVSKTTESIRRILQCGGEKSCFTIESPAHFEILEQCAKEVDVKLNCYIRLSSGNQFGVDRATLKLLHQKMQTSENLTFLGIHYFSGTQKTGKRIETELRELAEYMTELEKLTGRKPELEYGPGLSVNYFREKTEETQTEKQKKAASALRQGVEKELNEAKEKLAELTDIVARTGIREVCQKVTFEYGRFIAANAGFYFTKAVDIKTTNEVNYTILDGGIHQISYYGSMAGMKVPYMEVFTKQESSSRPLKEYVLAGSLCSVNDILVRKAVLPELNREDVIGFGLAGAYASTEGLSLFLSRDLPAIVIREKQGNLRLLREHIETNGINDGTNQ